MYKFLVVFLFTAALAARAALPQPDLIARIHFAGGDAVAADKNYPPFASEFSSPEALALRQQVTGKLAPWLAGWLQAKAGAGISTENLRPLFDDLQNAEWFFEARTAAGQPAGYFAIKLNPARLQLWKSNLKSPAFEISDSNGWLFCLFGDAAGKLGLLQPPAPLAGWLECDVNWPELARWYPRVQTLDLPETKFSVSAAAGQLHLNGKLYSPQNFSTKLDPWRVPTNAIHAPLTSFTIVRGFSSWLAGQDWAHAWQLSPPANELFVWSISGMPFQTYAAVPVADSPAALTRLYQNLQPALAAGNARKQFVSQFGLTLNNNHMTLSGAPIVTPEITAERNAAGQFLLANAFPNVPGMRNLPPDLAQALSRPDLVYQHWETTAARFTEQFQYSQLVLMLTQHTQLDNESSAFKWAQKSSAAPGETTSMLTLTAPDQMTFTRTAPGGFTALEFLMLANWLNAPDFPHCNLDLPPLAERLKMMRAKRMHQQPPGSPALPH